MKVVWLCDRCHVIRHHKKKAKAIETCRPEQHDAMRRDGWMTFIVCKKPLWEATGDVMRPINVKKGGRPKKESDPFWQARCC